MNNFGVFVRSKIPEFRNLNFARTSNCYRTFEEDTIPLTPSNVNYELDENSSFSNTYVENQPMSYQRIDSSKAFNMDKSRQSPLSFDPKSNNNLINEWQAAYNITNAIQVSSILN